MTAGWAQRPWLSIDTETSGVDVDVDRIVQVAAVLIHPDGSTTDAWVATVNPGVPIPDGAAAIHGITTEMAEETGIAPAEALAEVAARVWAHQGTDGPAGNAVVMFNARFDWPLLIAEACRHDVEFPVFAPILDPYLLDRMCDRYRKGKRQLTVVADHYGVPLGDAAHGALADAVAAGRVMRKLVERFPELGDRHLARLFVEQVRGHQDLHESFVDYRRRTSDPTFDAPNGWPFPVGSAS